MKPEPVLSVWDFYDGVLSGFAFYGGAPHHYSRVFDTTADEYSDVFKLRCVTDELIELDRERSEIFAKWNEALKRGNVCNDSHPLNPGMNSRYVELTSKLDQAVERIEVVATLGAEFRLAPGQEDVPEGVERKLEVLWEAAT